MTMSANILIDPDDPRSDETGAVTDYRLTRFLDALQRQVERGGAAGAVRVAARRVTERWAAIRGAQ